MRYERTTPTGVAWSLSQITDHARVDGDDATLANMADAAAREIEDYCGLALITQTITATTGTWPGQSIALPIGPVQPDTTPSVDLVELDGSTTPITTGWWLETGRYPRLHFTDTTPGGRLRITYSAGYGDGPGDIPADLRHAVADHAARLYDLRGAEDAPPHLSPAAARICARHRRVKL